MLNRPKQNWLTTPWAGLSFGEVLVVSSERTLTTGITRRSRLLRGPALSLTSQGTGVAQFSLIVARAGANHGTDAYFYLWSLGLTPTSLLCVGVMYPLLLNDERISKRGMRRIRNLTPAFAVLFTVVGATWLGVNGRLGTSLIPLVVASGLNALIQARTWFYAVAAEAGGDPRWISGVAIPANALALGSLAVPWGNPSATMTAMVLALCVGNGILLVLMRHSRVGIDIVQSAAETVGSGTGARWFLGKSAVGYVGLALIQSTAVLLPPSSLTIVSLATKVVASITGTFANAIMPNLIQQSTDSAAAGARFLRVLLGTITVTSAVVVASVWSIRPAVLVPAVLLCMWVLTTSAAAVAQRMAFRFLPPNASRLTLASVAVVVVCTLLSTRSKGFDINSLLSSYAALDGAAAILLLWVLRIRGLSIVIGAALSGVVAIWISSLF